jgi:hypothetical protein
VYRYKCYFYRRVTNYFYFYKVKYVLWNQSFSEIRKCIERLHNFSYNNGAIVFQHYYLLQYIDAVNTF